MSLSKFEVWITEDVETILCLPDVSQF